jgi:hypothetical protein
MAVENHYHHTDTTGPASESSALTVIVAIVAILFIIGLGIFALRSAGYGVPAAGVNRDTDINVDLTPGDGAAIGGTTGAAPANP